MPAGSPPIITLYLIWLRLKRSLMLVSRETDTVRVDWATEIGLPELLIMLPAASWVGAVWCSIYGQPGPSKTQ